MGIKHNYQATGTNDGTKQVSVDRWNESHVIDSEVPFFVLAASPAAPANGYLNVYGKKIGGRTLLAMQGPSGLDTTLQPHLGGNKTALWTPPGNGTLVPGILGFNTFATTGTATTRLVATTNFATRMTRLGYVSSTTAGNRAAMYEGQAKYTTGNGDGIGGFHYRSRFVVSDAATVSGARMFVGMYATTTLQANADPSTFVNCVGVAQLASSSNLQIVYGGSSAQTPIDLGANFPANTLSADAYELSLFAKPNGDVDYQVTRLNTGHTATGTLAAAGLPTSNTLLNPYFWRCNNATALAVGLDICSLYVETDN